MTNAMRTARILLAAAWTMLGAGGVLAAAVPEDGGRVPGAWLAGAAFGTVAWSMWCLLTEDGACAGEPEEGQDGREHAGD